VTNRNRIFADQNVFDQQPDNFLTFNDAKRLCSTAQADKKWREGFCQAQECGTIIGLISDRLQLSTECLLALTQHRHALTQLFDRQEFFLVCVEKSFDTFADMG
jgi:hypothetical protein